jgi:hypothetical protein
VDEVIGYHQCVFQHKRATTEKIFCICQILEKNWEHNGTVCQLFVDFEKVYALLRREVFYNISIEFGIPMNQTI